MFYTGSPPLRVIIVKEGLVWSSVSAFISCQFRYLHILNHETPAYLIKNSLITIPLPKTGGKHNQPTNIGKKNIISCQFRYLHILNHETPAYLIKNSLITIPLPKTGGKHNQPTNIGKKNIISCQFRYLHILNHETPAYLIKNSLITIPLPKKGGKHNQPTNIGKKNINSEDGLVERSRVFLTVADADTLFGSWDRFAESWVTNFHFRAEASPTIFERDDLPRRLRVQ